MKRIIFACSVFVFSIPLAFSQDVEDHSNCGNYSKRIENNKVKIQSSAIKAVKLEAEEYLKEEATRR